MPREGAPHPADHRWQLRAFALTPVRSRPDHSCTNNRSVSIDSYLRPTALDEALAALAERPRVVLAGGTDHFPARAVSTPDEDILDVTALPGLRRIAAHDDHWWLPCLATWTDVIEAGLPPQFDGLVQAARQVGGVQVQNVGTLVGNLCNASPAADGTPCLLALGAWVELARA